MIRAFQVRMPSGEVLLVVTSMLGDLEFVALAVEKRHPGGKAILAGHYDQIVMQAY